METRQSGPTVSPSTKNRRMSCRLRDKDSSTSLVKLGLVNPLSINKSDFEELR